MEFEIRCKKCEALKQFSIEYTNQKYDIDCDFCGNILVEDFKMIVKE